MFLNSLPHIKYSNDGTKCISVVSKSSMNNVGKRCMLTSFYSDIFFQVVTLHCHEGNQELSFLFAKFNTFDVILRLHTKTIFDGGLSMLQKLKWHLSYSSRHKAIISGLRFEVSICFIFCNKLLFFVFC